MPAFERPLSIVTIVILAIAGSVTTPHAQGRFTGKFTDKWENPVVGALVLVEPSEGTTGGRQETTTDDDGAFAFVGLRSGQWEVEVHGDGYQPIRTAVNVRQLSDNRPLEVELDVLPSGGRFRGDTEFEADGGIPMIKFGADGGFEFEDAEGEGEGTYGISGVNAVLVVRDYDGPDDRFAVSQPVVVTAPSDQFLSVSWGESTLAKK
jgi:hypothetical protein